MGFRHACSCAEPTAIHGAIIDSATRQATLLASLMRLGYDDDMNLCGARGFVISVHSEEPINATIMPPTTDAVTGLPTTHDMVHDEAIEQCIMNLGICETQKNWKLYKLKNGFSGVSFCATNCSRGEDLVISMNVSGKNCLNVTGKHAS